MAASAHESGVQLIVGGVIDAAIVAVLITLLVWFRRRRKRKRDAALAKRWEDGWQYCASHPPVHFAHVTNAYESWPRRGVKAEITWLETGAIQDTWFERAWPHQGWYVVVSGSTGYGPHNRNPNVFFVNAGGLLDLLPPDAPAVWERCRARDDQHDRWG